MKIILWDDNATARETIILSPSRSADVVAASLRVRDQRSARSVQVQRSPQGTNNARFRARFLFIQISHGGR